MAYSISFSFSIHPAVFAELLSVLYCHPIYDDLCPVDVE